MSFRKLEHPVEPVVAEDGHDSRNDLTLDSSLTTVSHPVVEDLVLKEELRDHEVSSRIHLLLQVPDVVFSGRCLEMHLRIASYADTKEVSVFLLDVAHQVHSIVEAILLGHPICGTSRWIAPQGQQVLDAQVSGLVQASLDLLSVHECACEVHEDVEAGVLLNVRAKFECDVTCDATCIPGDVNPKWIGLSHPLDSFEEVLDTGLRLGWEILKRVVRARFVCVLTG